MLRHPLPTVLGVAAAALLLAGCSAPATSTTTAPPSSPVAVSPSATPSATVSAAPTPSASASYSTAEQNYLGYTKASTQSLSAFDDATLIALGREVCKGFAAKQDTGAIATALSTDPRATGIDPGGAVVVIGAAVGTLCPQYHDALQAG